MSSGGHDTSDTLVRDRAQIAHGELVQLENVVKLVQLHSGLDSDSHVLLIDFDEMVEFIRVDHESIRAGEVRRRVARSNGLHLLAQDTSEMNDLLSQKRHERLVYFVTLCPVCLPCVLL